MSFVVPAITFDWLVSDLTVNMAVLSTAGILGLVWAMLNKSFIKLMFVLFVFSASGAAFILVVGAMFGATLTQFSYSIGSFVLSLIFSGFAGYIVGNLALWVEEKLPFK